MRGSTLKQQRILLTGASSGIGRALAIALGKQGAQLAVAARRESLLQSLAEDIIAGGGKRPQVMVADLSQPGAGRALAEQARQALGGVDILINNAGVSPIGAQAELGDSDSVRAAFETNFWAPLALAQALLPAMQAQGKGLIVNVTSTVQAVPVPLVGYYAASKAALAQATRALRHELQDTPVRVMEMVPGSTETALRDIDLLPWREGPPRTIPPVAPEKVAMQIVAAIKQQRSRLVYPAYSLLPLELPVIGRLVAKVAAGRIDTRPRP